MANALCQACGREVHWRAGRGARLADLKSSCCGARMVGKTVGRPSKMRGRTREACVLCGRVGYHPGRLAKLAGPWLPRYYWVNGEKDIAVREPWLPVCWTHEPIMTATGGHRFEISPDEFHSPRLNRCRWCGQGPTEHQLCQRCLRPVLLCQAVRRNACGPLPTPEAPA